MSAKQSDAFLSIGGFGHDFHIVLTLDYSHQSLAYKGIILHDKNSNAGLAFHACLLLLFLNRYIGDENAKFFVGTPAV